MRHNNNTSHRPASPTFDELLSKVRELPSGYEGHILEGTMHITDPPSIARAHTLAEISAMVVAGSPLGDPVPEAWSFLSDVEIAVGLEGLVTADVAGWRLGRDELASATTPVRLVPAWVCEVLGGGSRAFTLTAKRRAYAELGVSHLWIADPEAQVLEVFENYRGNGSSAPLSRRRPRCRCHPSKISTSTRPSSGSRCRATGRRRPLRQRSAIRRFNRVEPHCRGSARAFWTMPPGHEVRRTLLCPVARRLPQVLALIFLSLALARGGSGNGDDHDEEALGAGIVTSSLLCLLTGTGLADISGWGGGDCRALAGGDSSYCTTDDCKGIVKHDSSYCKTDDCKAWAKGDSSYCTTDDCKGIVKHDKSYCRTDFCKGVASGDASYCNSDDTCKAIAKRDKSYCK